MEGRQAETPEELMLQPKPEGRLWKNPLGPGGRPVVALSPSTGWTRPTHTVASTELNVSLISEAPSPQC